MAKTAARRATRKTGAATGRTGARASAAKKYIYFYGNGKAEGHRYMKDTLGGKGSGLAEMTNAGLPVPPGFTISTDVCNLYYRDHGKLPPAIDEEIALHVRRLEKAAGATLGSTANPQPRPQ
jgi:pyruvate,orthophosphate dikinase